MSQNSGDMSEMADVPDAGFRLSPQQQRLRKLREASLAYRVCCAVEIDGPLDSGRLEEAIYQVTQAHETLRATFVDDLPWADGLKSFAIGRCTPDVPAGHRTPREGIVSAGQTAEGSIAKEFH